MEEWKGGGSTRAPWSGGLAEANCRGLCEAAALCSDARAGANPARATHHLCDFSVPAALTLLVCKMGLKDGPISLDNM